MKNSEKVENHDPFAKKDLNELNELEDEFEDGFFEKYKQ